MTKFSNLCFWLSVSVLSLVGCSTTESENINTEGFYAVYTLTEDAGGTRGDVIFYVGGETGTVIQLSDGDSVTCNGNTLNENQDFIGRIYYWGSCGALGVGNKYTFVFTRQVDDGDNEVYTSTVTMPSAVSISSPWDSATFTRGQTIPVTWNAGVGGDTVSVSISGSGQSADSTGTARYVSGDGSLADDGSHTLTSEATNPDSITGVISNAAITVTRSRSGLMDPGLDGRVSATRQDSVNNLTLNP
ncbi:MAG: hypothetical protein HRT44_03895 [Bdellovibrionales bacterium]|nr:hypothetical protein [Bdellovibrionales bacterium]NQZ18386.1 hypothetical protein [Bdellovibrionales bacterium]